MNLPNKLSILRVIMVPIFVLVMVLPFPAEAPFDTWIRIIAAAVFILTALTDMLDGQIARRFKLVTDFGKFIDPLADKFMIFGAMLGILYRYDYIRPIFIWAALIVIFRELAITSMRLIVVNKSGTVVAAAWLGKVKTVTQVVCIVTILLEPVIIPAGNIVHDWHLLSYLTIIAMTVMTLWSGIDYMKAYWPQLDPNK
ncbi:MAG: CDP-diacylglycerol--glycerol-3-phosphate 3-phosphatidyltransferase [Clostridia bacterium]|nr:CDP-diacylglycerol--glycerol-3-phosphate 3-phosphatidyltransferase [Clostridia bacterium]